MKTKIEHIVNNPMTGKEYKAFLENVKVQKHPHLTFNEIWASYTREGKMSNNSNGRIFEYAICDTLIHHGVGKLYYQCKFWSLPNDRFDIGGWTIDEYPVIISCKTSLRERWKQSELEGRILKSVFPKTKSYLVMLDEYEAGRLNERIKKGTAEGIDGVYLASNSQLDELVDKLKSINLVESSVIQPLKGTLFEPPSPYKLNK